MIKEVVLLNGQVINIGQWEYMTESVEVEPGKFEDRVLNPLPVGAEIQEMEVEQDVSGGWYVVGLSPESHQSPTDLIGAELTALKLQGIQLQQTVDALGAQLTAAKLEIIQLKGADSV